LVNNGRSYRLIGRELGLSKNTVTDIVKRCRAVQLVFMLLCFVAASAWGQEQRPSAELQHAVDAAPPTVQACAAVASLADSGAHALRSASVVGRDTPINLGSNQPVEHRDDYVEMARWNDEIAVVRIAGRTWEIAYNVGALDDTAGLIAATDGSAVCHFHTVWQPPTFRMLSNGDRGNAETYRALLFGHGRVPPTAKVDVESVWNSSGFPRHDLQLQPLSWRVDLMNDGQPLTLVRVELSSGAGARGCDFDMLGVVQNGRLTRSGLLESIFWEGGSIAPVSQALEKLLRPSMCYRLVETPVLDQDDRAYVLVDNTAQEPVPFSRVKLLVGARNGTMQPLALLSWRVRNQVDPPPKP
jgi:hypothetical protein